MPDIYDEIAGSLWTVRGMSDKPMDVKLATHISHLLREKYGMPKHDCVPVVQPIPMRLHCPECSELHIDTGEFETKLHHTHACQHCGLVWRPAVVPTVGVRFLPGFKDAP
jgi:rubredoxin